MPSVLDPGYGYAAHADSAASEQRFLLLRAGPCGPPPRLRRLRAVPTHAASAGIDPDHGITHLTYDDIAATAIIQVSGVLTDTVN